MDKVPFSRRHDCVCSCTTRHLPSSAWHKLNVVNKCSNGNFRARQRVAELKLDILSCYYSISHFEPFTSQNVAFLAISILDERNRNCPVWIILQSNDFSCHSSLVASKIT